MLLELEDVDNFLNNYSGWEVKEGELTKSFPFSDFEAGIGFVNQIALLAKEANHHPDLKITYSFVTVNLISHHENGITDKDINLAKKIDDTAQKGQS